MSFLPIDPGKPQKPISAGLDSWLKDLAEQRKQVKTASLEELAQGSQVAKQAKSSDTFTRIFGLMSGLNREQANQVVEPVRELADQTDKEIANSGVIQAAGAVLSATPGASFAGRTALSATNAFLGGVPSSAAPSTFQTAEQATSTGNGVADWAADQVGGAVGTVGAFMLGGGEAGVSEKAVTYGGRLLRGAKLGALYSAPAAGVRVAKGTETPLEATEDVALGAAQFAGFEGAGAIPNMAARIPAMIGVSAAGYGAEQGVHGEEITPAGLAGAAVTGAVFGIAGGHMDPHAAIKQMVVDAANANGVPPHIMLGLAESESSFNPEAKSPTGATGLFQFTKATAKAYSVDRNDPVSSADGAARYMKVLLDKHNGNIQAAIKEYKGFSIGGVNQAGVDRTLGLINKYGVSKVEPAAVVDPKVQEVSEQTAQSIKADDPGSTSIAPAADVVGDQAGEAIVKSSIENLMAPEESAMSEGILTEPTEPPPTVEPTPETTNYPSRQNVVEETPIEPVQPEEVPTESVPRRTPRDEMDLGEHEPYQSGKYLTDEPLIEHTKEHGPNAGETMRGVVADGLTQDEARAIDPYAFKKGEGYFIHEEHVTRPEVKQDAIIERPSSQDEARVLGERAARSTVRETTEAGSGDRIQPSEDLQSAARKEVQVNPEEGFQKVLGHIEEPHAEVENPLERPRSQAGTLYGGLGGIAHLSVEAGKMAGEASKALFHEDVAPATASAVEAIRDTADRIQGTFAPHTRSDIAERARQIGLQALGKEHRRIEQHAVKDRELRSYFNKLPDKEAQDFQLRFSEGESQPNKEMQAAAKDLRAFYDEEVALTRQVGRVTGHDLMAKVREDYNAGLYREDTKLAGKILGKEIKSNPSLATISSRGSRFLKGRPTFLKERIMEPRQHFERGEVFEHSNPYDQKYEYLAMSSKNRVAHEWIGNLLDEGIARAIDPNDKEALNQARREGLYHPNDPSFEVRAKLSPDSPSAKTHDIYLPQDVSKLLENHLSVGYQNALARAVPIFNAVHNMFSLFGLTHVPLTALNNLGAHWASFSSGVLHGNFNPKDLVGTATGLSTGGKIQEEYLHPGSTADPEVKEAADWMQKIGGGISRRPLEADHWARSFTHSFFAERNYIGAAPRAVLASMEKFMGLIFQHFVPAMKTDAWWADAKTRLSNLPPDATEFDKTKAVSDAWSSTDDRMGEVWRNRQFIKKGTMFWADLIFPRANWTIGTWKAMGKAVGGVYKAGESTIKGTGVGPGKRLPSVNSDVMFFPALAVAVGGINSIMQYAMIQQLPQDWKDVLLGARDGGTLPDGSPSRRSPVNYIKDIISLGTAPMSTMTAKTNPFFGVIESIAANRDYHGHQVYDPDASTVKQAAQIGEEFLKQTFLPFTYQNIKEGIKRGAGAKGMVSSLTGFGPVSSYVSESETGRILGDYWNRQQSIQPGKSDEEAAANDAQRQVMSAYRSGDKALGDKLTKDLNVPYSKAESLYKRSKMTALQSSFHGVDFRTAVSAYRAATPTQKPELHDIMEEKIAKHPNQEQADRALQEFGLQRPELTPKQEKAQMRKEQKQEAMTPSEAVDSHEEHKGGPRVSYGRSLRSPFPTKPSF